MTVGEDLVKRLSTCSSGYYYSGGSCYPNSSWYWWGRWVFAGVVIVVVVGILFLLACISARRRRRRGTVPMYGTGWMTQGPKPGEQQYQYGPPPTGGYQYGGTAPPPQYTPPVNNQYTGTTYNTGDGYYGGHNNDIPLQQPANAYTPGGPHGYEPPPGPPPNKIA